MTHSKLTAVVVIALMACDGAAAKEGTIGDSSSTASSTASRTTAGTSRAASTARVAPSGTQISATTQSTINSKSDKRGETIQALVSADVTNASGRVLIPAGSSVTIAIVQLEPGSDQTRAKGLLELAVTAVSVNGVSYPVSAALAPVAHHFEGRGITKDEAARIGAGTAVGAVVGQVIGKNTKSTVIGGAVGAVAGTAVAVRYAYRDVVVSAGTPITFTLTQSLNIPAR